MIPWGRLDEAAASLRVALRAALRDLQLVRWLGLLVPQVDGVAGASDPAASGHVRARLGLAGYLIGAATADAVRAWCGAAVYHDTATGSRGDLGSKVRQSAGKSCLYQLQPDISLMRHNYHMSIGS